MHAKKSLGQNFLRDPGVLARIVEAAAPGPDDTVLEIGPGEGVLTAALAARVRRVIAVELDHDLVPRLLKTFPLSSNVSIVEGDILKTDLSKLVAESPYKTVANIPYYVTAPIIQFLLEQPRQARTIVLMVQKEVGERLTAKPGDLSILGVAAQYYADASYLFTVPRTAFEPQPGVDSCVVKLEPKRPFDRDADKPFFRLVKAGFAQKRKTLANNLANVLSIPRQDIESSLVDAGLRPDTRAQALSVEDWLRLAAKLPHP